MGNESHQLWLYQKIANLFWWLTTIEMTHVSITGDTNSLTLTQLQSNTRRAHISCWTVESVDPNSEFLALELTCCTCRHFWHEKLQSPTTVDESRYEFMNDRLFFTMFASTNVVLIVKSLQSSLQIWTDIHVVTSKIWRRHSNTAFTLKILTVFVPC